MIPVSDVIPSRTTPWVTLAIIAINTSVFLYSVALPPDAARVLVDAVAFTPASANMATATSALFLHESALHLVLNTLALWVFGDNVEDQLGHSRYFAFYFLTGWAAALAEVWASPASAVPLIGATGAVAGVIGAHLVMFPRSRLLVLVPATTIVDIVEVPALLPIGVWFVLQVLGGLGRLTDPLTGFTSLPLWTAIGGFLSGALAGRALRQPSRRRVEWWGA